MTSTASSLSFVLFGATGDLAQKKIVPSLLTLYINNSLPEIFTLIAFSRRPWSDDDYRAFIAPSLKNKNVSSKILDSFLKHIVYVEGTFDNPESYTQLKNKIKDGSQIIYHLAVQPEFCESIIKGIGGNNNAQIIIEKPFAKDSESAEHLAKIVKDYFSVEQIYLIDHYLAKPGVLELEKQKEYEIERIESVRVKILEKIDIEGRGEFYDTIGALRDVGQNHALEVAASLSQDRLEFLKNITLSDEPVFFGQYEGYRQEKDVAPDSTTETYFEISFHVKDEKWKEVTFYIEGGKALGKKINEIIVTYKDKTQKVIDLEKSENKNVREAYEILLDEAIKGEKKHFVSIDEVVAAWKFITPILQHKNTISLHTYKKGIYPLSCL